MVSTLFLFNNTLLAQFGGICGQMVIVIGNGLDVTEFKSWSRQFAFHFVLMPLEKA